MTNHLKNLRLKHKIRKVTPTFLDEQDIYESGGRGPQVKPYRYWTKIEVDPSNPKKMLVFLLCPPPVYHAPKRQMTIERLVSRAKLHGYGRVGICYLFARKASIEGTRQNLRVLNVEICVGELNDQFAVAAIQWADTVFFAWGKAPKNRQFARNINERAVRVFTICAAYFKMPTAFKISLDGWPLDPLFIHFDEKLDEWRPPMIEPAYPRESPGPSIMEGLY
jgi:hypothetical protein